MPTKNGLLSHNLRVSLQGTRPAVPPPHAAFLRPCARNPRGEPQTVETSEEDVVIVVGPNGPRIQFCNNKTYRREEE